jgi:tellurite resistance protein TerC
MHESIGTPWLWAGFVAFVLAMLALDLGVLHKKDHEISVREALAWTGVWIALSLLFNTGIYFWFGRERALEFLSGYVIEKALSVDNIYVFIVVFSVFAVPSRLQRRVLLWGILSALVLRAVFVILGAALLSRFHWLGYVFGAFLVVTGIKLLLQREGEVDPRKNPLFRLFRRAVPAVEEFHEGRFTIVEAGKRYATPLLLVLVAIEGTDIVFAMDSIPAIFAVTRDPFIVFTSNIFAILGLRALYFALSGMMDKFQYLKYGLALVLMFVGAKMLLAGVYKIPIWVSLGAIAALLAGSIIVSLVRRPPKEPPDSRPAASSGTGGSVARKVSVAVLGGVVLLAGVAMIVLPGPAFLVIPIGLTILASEFEWPRRMLTKVRQRARSALSRRRPREPKSRMPRT